MLYNEEHHITPKQIEKALKQSDLRQFTGEEETKRQAQTAYISPMEQGAFAADPIVQRMTRPQLEKSIAETTRLMKEAAKKLDFLQAAQYRDEIIRLQKELELK
jgi:excinuclease ABC subunit B